LVCNTNRLPGGWREWRGHTSLFNANVNDSTSTIHIAMLMEPHPADEDTLITTVQQHVLEPRHFHLYHIQRRTPLVHVTIAFNEDH
jgi:hypothetical protein